MALSNVTDNRSDQIDFTEEVPVNKVKVEPSVDANEGGEVPTRSEFNSYHIDLI